MKTDILILGSGLGGLLCADILTRAGRSVTVLERQQQPGGCMQSFRRNGLNYDTGLHYVGGLGKGQTLGLVFQGLGLNTLPWHQLNADGFDHVTIDDEEYTVASGYDHFVDTLAERFPEERQALKDYCLLLSSIDEHTRATILGTQPASITEPMTTGAWAYLNSHFHSPELISVLSAPAQKMELCPDSLPLFTFAHGNNGYIQSSWRLAGSGNTLVSRLIGDIRRQGGNVLCMNEVEALECAGGKVTAARCTNGTRHEADLFVSDLHPALTTALISPPSALRPLYRHRIASLPNTYGILTVQLRLKPQRLPYFNYNHYIYRHADPWHLPAGEPDGSGGLLISCKVPGDDSRWTTQVDLLTPMRWEAVSAWSDTSHGQRAESYNEAKQRWAESCIDMATAAEPRLRDSIEEVYVSTPLTFRDYNHTPEGSAFGVRKDYHTPLLSMLSVHTPLSNLLLTGQSLNLHGVEGVTLTALQTCEAILGKKATLRAAGLS